MAVMWQGWQHMHGRRRRRRSGLWRALKRWEHSSLISAFEVHVFHNTPTSASIMDRKSMSVECCCIRPQILKIMFSFQMLPDVNHFLWVNCDSRESVQPLFFPIRFHNSRAPIWQQGWKFRCGAQKQKRTACQRIMKRWMYKTQLVAFDAWLLRLHQCRRQRLICGRMLLVWQHRSAFQALQNWKVC